MIDLGVITSAEDAYTEIGAGASLVQLYTALVFAGRALGQIKSGVGKPYKAPCRYGSRSSRRRPPSPGNSVREVCPASI
jgi:hypothetical protein